MTTRFGVTGIGNAIIDILADASHEFIADQHAKHGMQAGSMTLIDAARARDLYAEMGQCVQVSGGSAANTMACYSSFGGKGAYIGVVADDTFGTIFSHDMKALDIHFNTSSIPASAELGSGQCLILVTPDAQRTMNTYLGACTQLSPEHIDESVIADSEITYLEGYLFDQPPAKQAFIKAANAAKAAGRKTALSLSDPFCVERYRAEFQELIKHHIDILFANELELIGLYQTATLEEALDIVSQHCPLSAVTCGENGSVIVKGNERIKIAPIKPTQLVDTTGAGDAYAAGFLYGYTHGKELAVCGQYGSLAASEVISHFGPRPQSSLADLVKTQLQAA